MCCPSCDTHVVSALSHLAGPRAFVAGTTKQADPHCAPGMLSYSTTVSWSSVTANGIRQSVGRKKHHTAHNLANRAASLFLADGARGRRSGLHRQWRRKCAFHIIHLKVVWCMSSVCRLWGRGLWVALSDIARWTCLVGDHKSTRSRPTSEARG